MSRPTSAEPSSSFRVAGLHRLVLMALLALAFIATIPQDARAAFAPVFRPPEMYDVGGQPFAIAAGDLNGDGLPDLVVGRGSGGLAILLHYGTGSAPVLYRPAIIKTLPVTNMVTDVKLVDMNKDGALDVVATLSAYGYAVLLGDGRGNLGNPTIYTIPGCSAIGTAKVGDVDGDGWLDVVSRGSCGVYILFGTGGGVLGPAVNYPSLPTDIAGVQDLTGDGIADLWNLNGDSLFIWPGNTTRTFTSSLAPVPLGINTSTDHVWTFTFGDLNGDAVPDFLYSWTSNYGQSNAAQLIGILLGIGGGGFQAPASYPSSLPGGEHENWIQSGDMDGDGAADLVALYSPSQLSALEVIKGSGTGTLGAGSLYEEPSRVGDTTNLLEGATLVDVDGDGKSDLVATLRSTASSPNAHCIAVVRNDGSGGFAGPVVSSMPSGSPQRSVVADFNRDGKPDVAFTDPNFIGIGAGDGSGAFTLLSTTGYSSFATGVTVGDIDDNGTADLVISDGIHPLAFFPGNGAGSFGISTSIGGSTPYTTYGRSAGDMNRDGLPDVVVADPFGSIVVLDQSTPGGFVASPPVSFMASPVNDLVLGDFNRDGYLDMAGATGAGLGVMLGGPVTLGNPAGLQFHSAVMSGRNYTAVCAGDFNRDGILDLAARESADSLGTGRGVDVFLGDGTGNFTLAGSIPTMDPRGYTIEAVDVNHDGRLDLVTQGVFFYPTAFDPPDAEVEVHLGHGDGTFDAIPLADGLVGTMNPNYSPFTVADVDRDATPDVIASIDVGSTSVISTTHINSTSKGNGLLPASFYPTVSFPRSVAVADLNRDGKLDVVTCTPTSAPGVTVHLGNGDGSLGTSQVLSLSGRTNKVAIADFNRDGIPDIAALNDTIPPFGIATMLGVGNGSFQAPSTYFFHAGLDFAVGDINRDGIPDLVVATPDSVRVLIGSGDGRFVGSPGYRASLPNCSHIELADLNRDGYVDVVCACGSVKVLYGGPVGFQAPVTLPGPITTCQTLCVADFNRDGFLDIEANQSGQWYILWGAATSPFSTSAVSSLPFAPSAVIEGDAEANGTPYLYAVRNPDQVEVLSVSPAGAIASVGSYVVKNQPGCLALGDFNRDGGLDVLSASPVDSTLAVNLHGAGSATGVEAIAAAPPAHARLLQNYPNPFNPRTTIRYALAQGGHVRLAVFDVQGRLVETLRDGVEAAGEHAVAWDGRGTGGGAVGSGVYFYQLTTESGEHESKRMILLK